MYSPVLDYLDDFNIDFDRLINYFGDYYVNDIDENIEKIIKEILKDFWILRIWQIEFEKNNNNYYLYNDILLNYLASFHVVIHKDIKVLNYLIRSSIEDFIKFSKYFTVEFNEDLPPRDIFPKLFEFSKNDEFLHKNFENIRTIYSRNCQYVHSAKIKEDNLCDCLINYDDFYDLDELRKTIDDFNNVTRYFNNVLICFNINIFKTMTSDYQFFIRDYTNSKDLDVIYNKILKQGLLE